MILNYEDITYRLDGVIADNYIIDQTIPTEKFSQKSFIRYNDLIQRKGRCKANMNLKTI